MIRSNEAFHWPLLLFTLGLVAAGLTNLYSASFATNPGFFFSQVVYVGVAVIGAALVFFIDYRIYERVAWFFYGLGVLLLVVVLTTRPIGGSQRWIPLGGFQFQPSEFMKLALVILLARFFHHAATPKEGFSLIALWKPFLIVLIPAALVFIQPDLGTAGLLVLVAFAMFMYVRIRTSHLLGAILLVTVVLSVVWTFEIGLKEYQIRRVETLFDPDSDPRGTGYHRRQSIIAVGSGQAWGKGFMEGTQTQLRFLPEQHTDFIFSVWAEEQGFVGSAGLLLLYAGMILSGLHIASKAREKFGVLCAVGATAVLFWHAVINIGMVIGLLPVVGVTLPLMSKGGSSLLVSAASIGLLLNIHARHRLF